MGDVVVVPWFRETRRHDVNDFSHRAWFARCVNVIVRLYLPICSPACLRDVENAARHAHYFVLMARQRAESRYDVHLQSHMIR